LNILKYKHKKNPLNFLSLTNF